MNIRTDMQLIRFLAKKHGLEAASIYNRLPLFVVADDFLGKLDLAKEALLDIPDYVHLPFNDFIIEFPSNLYKSFGITFTYPENGKDVPVGDLKIWSRVRSIPDASKKDAATVIAEKYIKQMNDAVSSIGCGIFFESWGFPPIGLLPDEFIPASVASFIPNKIEFIREMHFLHNINPAQHENTCPKWCNTSVCPSPSPDCKNKQSVHDIQAKCILLAIAYVTERLGGDLTEVTYTPAKGSKEEKSEKLKPWTAPRRSNFIMIDPLSAKKYGHPSTRNPSGRSHASPVPHQRRGHKRTYANEKKIWINPTWVGEREWVSEGRTYKIISK